MIVAIFRDARKRSIPKTKKGNLGIPGTTPSPRRMNDPSRIESPLLMTRPPIS